jgi:hypothetical protein
MENEITNKVANSGIVSIDLEEFYVPGERVLFDIKPHLFQELILKEKDFREFIKTNDWSLYKDKIVGLVCTADAIVPTWAYMLLTLALEPFAKRIIFGNLNEIEKAFGKPDTWANVMTDVEYSNNKFNDGLAKTITAFNSNKNNYTKSISPVTYETRKFGTGKEYKVPVYEVIPDYNKALQLAMVQNESMKKKTLQQVSSLFSSSDP